MTPTHRLPIGSQGVWCPRKAEELFFMIRIETCLRCGRPLFVEPMAGLKIKCDPEPLDAQAAVQALVGGRSVWAVRLDRQNRPCALLGATPAMLGGLTGLRTPAGRPTLVAEHRCSGTAQAGSQGLPTPQVAPEPTPCPKGPEKPVQGAARGKPAERATPRRTEKPVCDGCGQPCADGTYAAVHLGELVVWAQHVDSCGAQRVP